MRATSILTLAAILLSGTVAAEPAKRAESPPAGRSAPALRTLVEEAIGGHPSVAQRKHAVRARREVPSRVSALPDPLLLGSLQNVPYSDPRLNASAMTGILFTLSQTLPYPGKLARKGKAARAEVDVAEAELLATRFAIALRVARAYWRLHFAEKAVRITADSATALDTLVNVVIARFAVAQTAQQDALQAQVAHSRLRSVLARRRQAVVTARRVLNAAIGRPPDARMGTTAEPAEATPRIDRSRLLRRAREKNVDLAVSRSRERAASSRLREADRDRYPDFHVAVGYRLRFAAQGDPTEGADMGVITFGSTLPVWMGSKQSARVREEGHRLDEARASTRNLALDVVTEMQRQIDSVERLSREIGLYRREVLPEADQALDASIGDYQFANVEFVSVLQNWEAQLAARLENERLLAERAERLEVIRALAGVLPGEPLP